MTDDVSPQLLKALFSRLVERCGGAEAAAMFLGVSRQRVQAIQSLGTQDFPTLVQVWRLQKWIRDPFVFEALAADVRAQGAPGDVAKEAREVTYAAVDLLRCTDGGNINWSQIRVERARLATELEDLDAVIAAAPI